MKIYDVYFSLAQPMISSVEANSKQEAITKFKEQFEEMDKNEILDLFLAALNYDPDSVVIHGATLVDKD